LQASVSYSGVDLYIDEEDNSFQCMLSHFAPATFQRTMGEIVKDGAVKRGRLNLDSVCKDNFVSLVKELKKRIGAKDLEAPELTDWISRMMLVFTDEKEFKPEYFLKAFDFLLENEDLSKSEVAQAPRL